MRGQLLYTPLAMAAQEGRADACTFLLTKGAKVALANKMGDTALHVAAAEGKVGAVRVLLNHGADINVRGCRNYTPLIGAAHAGQAEACKFLLSRGANPALVTDDGNAAVHAAALFGGVDVLRVLLDHGDRVPCINVRGWKRYTPLLFAVEKGDIGACKFLLARGADASLRCDGALSAAHFAALAGRTDILQVLLDKGADMSARDDSGFTPLVCAVRAGHAEVCKFLLANDAKTRSGPPDESFLIALHFAVVYGTREVAAVLVGHRAAITARGPDQQ
jgi:cytohesin